MKLFADHFRTALGTDTVDAALTSNMRFFMPALRIGADTVPVWARTRFVAAAPATSPPCALTSTTLAASATKDFGNHKIQLLFLPEQRMENVIIRPHAPLRCTDYLDVISSMRF